MKMNDVVEFVIVFFSLLFTAFIDLCADCYFSHKPVKKRKNYFWVYSKQFGTGQTLTILNRRKENEKK